MLLQYLDNILPVHPIDVFPEAASIAIRSRATREGSLALANFPGGGDLIDLFFVWGGSCLRLNCELLPGTITILDASSLNSGKTSSDHEGNEYVSVVGDKSNNYSSNPVPVFIP